MLRLSRIFFLILVVTATSSVFSQERLAEEGLMSGSETEQQAVALSTSLTKNSPESEQVSSVKNESLTGMTLAANSQYTEMAPGICLVISDYLKDFCVQYPGDSSCQQP